LHQRGLVRRHLAQDRDRLVHPSVLSEGFDQLHDHERVAAVLPVVEHLVVQQRDGVIEVAGGRETLRELGPVVGLEVAYARTQRRGGVEDAIVSGEQQNELSPRDGVAAFGSRGVHHQCLAVRTVLLDVVPESEPVKADSMASVRLPGRIGWGCGPALPRVLNEVIGRAVARNAAHRPAVDWQQRRCRTAQGLGGVPERRVQPVIRGRGPQGWGQIPEDSISQQLSWQGRADTNQSGVNRGADDRLGVGIGGVPPSANEIRTGGKDLGKPRVVGVQLTFRTSET